MDLLQCIDQIFSETGTLVQLGGRHTTEQHQYAKYVAQSLLNTGSTLSILEAETGIGKTIGYLTPILAFLAIKNSNEEECGKIVISTHTRQLQKQIFDNDLSFAIRLIESIGLVNSTKTAYRMGRQAFFSYDRTINACNSLRIKTPKLEKELRAFIGHVKRNITSGSGLWSSYLEEYGAFPAGIRTKDICLLDKQNVDNDAYKLHLERANNCDILITNHISLLQPHQTGLSNIKIETVILDEAHTIPELCLELFNSQSSLNEIDKSVCELGLVIGKSKLKQAELSIEKINSIIKSSSKFEGNGVICQSNDTENFNKISKCVHTISAELTPAIQKLEKKLNKSEYTITDVEFLNDLEKISSTLTRWQNQNSNAFQLSAVTLSEVHCKPSLSSLNLFGSHLFASIIAKLTDKVILTSGTISDISINGGFDDFKRSLGFKKIEIDFQCSLAPQNYSDLKFVLCGSGIPHPINDRTKTNYETTFNADWMNNTVKMLNKAKELGEKVLVLTVSHKESIELAEELGNTPDLAVHHAGNTLSELAKSFAKSNSKQQVLITSAGWEGLNLRNSDGDQLIHHLFITRIPFAPPQELQEFLVKEFIRINGNTSISNEVRLNWFNMLKKTIPKFRQGIGRSTRGPKDVVTIWIADSRMPHTRKDILSPLLKAIPKRFMDSYFKAEVFGETKKKVFFV